MEILFAKKFRFRFPFVPFFCFGTVFRAVGSESVPQRIGFAIVLYTFYVDFYVLPMLSSTAQVCVVSTSGQELPVQLEPLDGGSKFRADFVPFEVGPHTVSVQMNGEPVGGSPFVCNVYDVSKVLVTGLASSSVRPALFLFLFIRRRLVHSTLMFASSSSFSTS